MALLTFDWGGTSVKTGIWANEHLITLDPFLTPETWTDMKTSMIEVFHEQIQKYDLKGIAISSPGSVDEKSGIVKGISAIDYIHNFKIVEELEALFDLPVSIENDANCAALAELWQGAGKHLDNLIFVVVGTGIGGAVINNGKLQKGNNLFGGEFGCMLMENNMSFSMLGTAVHMAERYAKRKNIEGHQISGEDVFVLAKEGDEIAIDEVEKFYNYLSTGLYNLQFVTDPQAIIIGGGISRNEEIITRLNNQLNKMLLANNLADVKVEVRSCKFKNDANLVGAAAAFQEQKGERK